MAKKQKKLDEISKKFGDERQKALDNALKNIEKDFGKGAIMRLGERAEQKVQVMSSGSLALDIALGAGGYPKGRSIEIYGPLLFTQLLKRKKKVVSQPLSMLSMLWIRHTRLLWVLILMSCCCLNQILGSRDWKLLVS